MKNIKIFVIACLAVLLSSCHRDLEISEWVQSSPENFWTVHSLTDISSEHSDSEVVINPKGTLQTVEGFGSCFNEQGWASLSALSPSDRTAVLAELYEPGKGAALTLGRMPVAANDFSLDYYSYDGTDGDFQMKDFSISHDEKTLLPYIKNAMKYQPELKLWASPWCPPEWMKKNMHYGEMAAVKWNLMIRHYQQSMKDKLNTDPLRFRMELLKNDTPEDSMGYEGVTSFIMQPKYLRAYAKYFGMFVDAYKKEGVNITMVMPQNEPNSNQPYPSCCWTARDLNTFIGKYLGPEMKKHHVEVFAGTCERPDPQKVDTILSDRLSARYVRGAGFQWAGLAALPVIHQRYPHLTLYATEQECGNGLNNWEGAMHSWNLMKEYFRGGVNAYFYWNTSLFENKASRWGWYQNSLVTVNEKMHSYRFTPEYYMLKHASHYIRPGAKFLKQRGNYKDAIAFVNPDQSLVVLMANQANHVKNVSLVIAGKVQTVSLEPNTVNTFLLK